MDQSLDAHWIVPICMVSMAASFLAIGLRGLLIRHPFVISGRWVLLYLGMWAILQFGWIVQTVLGGHLSQQWLLVLFGLLASAVFMATVWFSGARGYWVYGVTTTSLHEGLRASLQALGLRNEIGFGGVCLLPSGACIAVSTHQQRGVGRIKGDRHARPLLPDVVAGMNRYYAVSKVRFDRTACVLYTAAGVLLLAVALYSFLHR